MAKLFIGLALAIMLATAVLGFLAKSNIDKLHSALKGSKAEVAKEQSGVQTAKNDLKKSTEERDAANTKAEEAVKNLEKKEDELKNAKSELDNAKSDVTAKATALDEANKKIADMTAGPKPVVDNGEPPMVTEMKAQLQKAQAELAEAKTVLESQVNKGKENERLVMELRKKDSDRAKNLTRPGLQGRILAVNAGWNFVVLSVGDKQGVTINAPLLVVRGNSPIARLRITSVEPSTSIADVIPGSVARGVTVQPGDTVIFEGRTSATEPPKVMPEAEPPATPRTQPPIN